MWASNMTDHWRHAKLTFRGGRPVLVNALLGARKAGPFLADEGGDVLEPACSIHVLGGVRGGADCIADNHVGLGGLVAGKKGG